MIKKTVGFIGLGVMGKPMAMNLIKAGFSLIAHNRSRAPVEALVAAGASAAATPREVAQRADVIITMLPDTPDVDAVVQGTDGILRGIRPGTIYVDMSTISPVTARFLAGKIAEKGAAMLDAPVSGGDVGARNATLSIMVGGPKDTFDACQDVFQALGKTIVRIGDSGAGQIAKACNQIIVGMNLTAIGEALVLAAKAGVDPARVVQALAGGLAGSRALDLKAPKVLSRDFAPGFRSKLHYKDLGIALATGSAYGVPLPVTGLIHELFGAMLAAGRADLDHSGIVTVIEDLARIEVRPAATE